jgi:large subunit ribosomal protein L3
MPGLIGRKIGMTSLYNASEKSIPVTAVEIGPCTITDIKTKERDGYIAVQLGFGSIKEKAINNAQLVNFKKNNLQPAKYLKEFRNFDITQFKVGEVITVETLFKEGEKVSVIGISKGKGFQGVMRRHGFSGVGGRTHGQSDRERAPGSVGASSYPSRVLKGTRMAGRTGNDRVTVKSLEVVKILPEKNIIFIKGALPGAINSIVEINK